VERTIKRVLVPSSIKLKACNKLNAHSPQALASRVAKERLMKRIFLAAAALAISGAAALTPANAQGVGVQVGPVGVGVGVDAGPYRDGGYHHRHWRGDSYGYASECRVIRERTQTPSGRVIVRSRRICD
jgi:hypothetical protein